METLLSPEALACPHWMQFYLSGIGLGFFYGAGTMFVVWAFCTQSRR
jgi:hypothetical protein